MERPIIESIPTAALPQEPAPTPRRKPGRKPAVDAFGNRIHPPRPAGNRKRGGIRRSSPSTARKPKSLREPIAALLTMVNMALLMSPLGTRPIAATTDPNVVPERVGDELDAAEISALAAALDMQCQRSPRFRSYVEGMLSVGSGGALITTLGIIATRRAARHGLAPAALDPMLGMALAGDNLDALVNMAPAPDTTPDPETGETPPTPLPVDFLGMEA
jgi:hypothetical protein